MKLLIVGCLCMAVASAETISSLKQVLNNTIQGIPTPYYAGADTLDKDIILTAAKWGMYKLTYKKEYEPHVDQKKLKTFLLNAEKIRLHNEQFKEKKVSYSIKINRFTDMTVEEVRKMLNGFEGNTTYTTTEGSDSNLLSFVRADAPPPSFDWRKTRGAISPVKDQGQCGSCWAFSAVGALEAANFINNGDSMTLSEQELMDCDFRNKGCTSGNMARAFQYVIENRGINSDYDYPYEAREGGCRSSGQSRLGSISGYNCLPSNNIAAMKYALVNVGPLSVACNSDLFSFIHYSEGLYNDPNCHDRTLDHAVTVVAYGKENGKEYWVLKNSWGTGWGDAGFMKMETNLCGISRYACYPVF